MSDSETGVKHEITDRDPEELSDEALVAEWREAAIVTAKGITDDEERERYWYRRVDLWQEMKLRADAEEPECPECGGQSWSQNSGDPKACGDCGLELGRLHEDLIGEIDAYWEQVQSIDGGAAAV